MAKSRIVSSLTKALIVAVSVVVLTFLLVRLVPGDPVTGILGSRGSPEARNALREQLNLNRPLPVQFAQYVNGLVHGDLGTSAIERERSVSGIIKSTLPVSMSVILATVVFSLLLGIPLGLIAAVGGSSRLDFGIRVALITLLAAPPFFLGLILLLVFSLHFNLLPAGGWGDGWPDNLRYVILPAVALSCYLTPVVARTIRQAGSDTLGQQWVETAVARGLPRRTIIARHLLPNSVLPVITLIGINIGALIAGAVVVEQVFGLPGIGSELINAVAQRDYPVIQGIALVSALVVVLANLGADLLYSVVDPRTRQL